MPPPSPLAAGLSVLWHEGWLSLRSISRRRDSRGRPLTQHIAKGLFQPLVDVRHELRRLRLSERVGRLFAHCVMHHQHTVQLFERYGIVCSAHRRVRMQHTLNHAGIEDPYLAEHCEPGHLAIELFEVVRPPRDTKV